MGADEIGGDLAGDGNDRSMVQLDVVKTVEQMDGARSGGAHTGREPTGQVGLCRCGKGARLFVAHADKGNLVLPAYGVRHIVDSIPWDTEQVTDSVRSQCSQQDIGYIPGYISNRLVLRPLMGCAPERLCLAGARPAQPNMPKGLTAALVPQGSVGSSHSATIGRRWRAP